MNIKLSNQLNMVGACLTIAQNAENKAVWDGHGPADFALDLARLDTDYQAALAKAAQLDGAQGGSADAKAVAETALEEAAHVLARALTVHFQKTSAWQRLRQVDLSRTDIGRLRNQELLARATEIRDAGVAAKDEPGAAGRGVTPERLAALTAAIDAFAAVMSVPRSQIVNRSTLAKELETDIAGLLVAIGQLDDLALQFGGTPAGDRFVETWRRARMIIDRGGTNGNGDAPKPAATPPVPPAT